MKLATDSVALNLLLNKQTEKSYFQHVFINLFFDMILMGPSIYLIWDWKVSSSVSDLNMAVNHNDAGSIYSMINQ